MKYALKPSSLMLPLVAGVLAGLYFQNFSVGVAVFAVCLMPALIALYIPYAQHNPNRLWFKRKLYGWGWTPVTWEGWLTTVIYVGLAMLFALTIDEQSTSREVAFTFVIPFVLLTVAFLRIAYKKGESPKWQWGRNEEES